MGQRNYKPRHARRDSSFQPRSLDIERHRRQSLYHDGIWREFSKRFLKINPECYACGEPSEATDHIEPHIGRKDVFQRTANHIALCFRCHNTVTAKFDKKFKAGASLEPKLKWLNGERARNEMIKNRTFKKPKAMIYGK